MDDERTPTSGTEQDEVIREPEAGEERGRPPFSGAMFAAGNDDELAMRRAVRRRALIWGLLGGVVASILMVVCAGLIYLAGAGG